MPRRSPNLLVAGVMLLATCMFFCCGGLLLFRPRNLQTSSVVSAVPVPVPVPVQGAVASTEPKAQDTLASNSKPVGEVNNLTAADIFGSATAIEASDVSPVITKSNVQPTGLDVDDRSVKSPPFREWNARAGGFKTTAKFIKMTDGQIELQKQGGSVAKVPLEKLSRVDVEYVQDLIRVHPTANIIIGKVLAAASSNSILLSEEGKQVFVELYGIATPGPGQEYYREAKEDLTNKVVGKHVWVEWLETNKDSKPIGIVYVNGRNANLELVADGVAWHDVRVSADQRLANAEFIARQKKLGLWKLGNPLPPWEHR